MPTIKKAEAAWGGIGGSGKHAGEAVAELFADPEIQRKLNQADFAKKSWGGIGGSGKHAADIEPEVVRPQ